ncbi:MAG: T9SS type A sorting domain-containing protein [Ignavibacteriales bacterium]|nr:T9SS type A sorting domain-containing protein [Ignavibacteriales bacterium]
MKTLILFFCFIPLISSFSQEILLSRDTMSIGNKNYRDSITIYNKGIAILRIDSIKCRNTNYAFVFISNDHQTEWKPLEEYVKPENVIEIQSYDSLKVRMSIAYVLTKQIQANYDQIDTMYFYNNSINEPIQSIEISNKFIMGGVDDEDIPIEYSLSQNYPNPFNPNTKIFFSLNRGSQIVLTVYDAMGKEIKELIREYLNAGKYEVIFDGRKLSSGIYFYRLLVGLKSSTRKMLLLK